MIKYSKFVIKNYLTEKVRTGKQYKKIYTELCGHDKCSLDDLRNLQQEKLKTMINYAYDHCEYYRESFLKANIKPEDIKTIHDLKKVPILTKNDIRNNFHKICSSDRKAFLHTEYTSGTTGKALKVIRDLYSINYENAAISRIYKWAGYEKGDRIAYIRGYDCDINYYSFLNKILYINACNLTNILEETYNLLIKYNIKFIYSVSSTAELLSSYIINFKKNPIKLKGIITSSETLTPIIREKVNKAFQCKVYDYYGNTERVAMIANCSEEKYHLILDYGAEYLRHISDNYYEIISTNLFNYSMPIINYATGDIVEIENEVCKCGRPYPVIKNIIGRKSNYLTISGKKVYSATLSNVYHGIKDNNIIQSQFIQETDGKVTLNVVLEDKNNLKSLNVILDNFKTWFDYHDLNIIICDNLVKSKSGKIEFIIKR